MNDCGYGWYDYTPSSQYYWIDTWWDGAWEGYINHWMCPNPMTLIRNHGQVEMDNISVNVNVTESVYPSNSWYSINRCFNFDDDGDYGFISNYGTMTITDLSMERSLSRYMLYNEGMSIFRQK